MIRYYFILICITMSFGIFADCDKLYLSNYLSSDKIVNFECLDSILITRSKSRGTHTFEDIAIFFKQLSENQDFDIDNYFTIINNEEINHSIKSICYMVFGEKFGHNFGLKGKEFLLIESLKEGKPLAGLNNIVNTLTAKQLVLLCHIVIVFRLKNFKSTINAINLARFNNDVAKGEMYGLRDVLKIEVSLTYDTFDIE